MTDVDLRQLRYFVCVAESSSLRTAAERLHITQPSLSRQIRALERDLAVRLFDRTTRGVQLTDDGHQLLGEARALLRSSEELMTRPRSDAVRPSEPSADARAVRTRRRLVDAYIRVSVASPEPPRVSAVVRAAGVNRSSFYAHFDDIEDLTLHVVDEALGDLARSQAEMARKARQSTRVTALTAGGAYLDALTANVTALSAAIRTSRPQVRARIGATMERTMLEFLSFTPGWDSGSGRSRAIASFVGHGWAGAICAWLDGDLPLERDALLAELVALNPDPRRLPGIRH